MKKRIVMATGLVVFVWLVIVTGLLTSAYIEAKAGRAKLVSLTTSDIEQLRSGNRDVELQSATRHLQTAHSRVSNPLLAPLRPLPLIGAQLASARDLTEAGAITSSIALDALRAVRDLSGNQSLERSATLRRAAEICSTSDARLRQAELGPKGNLLGPLQRARIEAVTRLNQVDSALVRCAAGADGLATLLTSDATYLLLAANNAEMRNGAGMFLQAGLLRTGGGELTVGDMESVGGITVPDAVAPWPAELEKNWGFLGRRGDLRNVMLSPRYDVGAYLAMNIWEESGRPPVDGVIAVDVAMMKALVAVSGPVTVDGQTITADNVERTLLYDQYQGLGTADASAQAERREDLGQLARAAFSQFASGDWPITAAAKELGQAAQGRHLLIWSTQADLNQKWVTAGVGGVLQADSLLVAPVNLGTNKLDQFLKVDSTLDVRRNGDLDDLTVTVQISNSAPVEGPRYVLGPLTDNGAAAGQYVGVLAATVPGDSTNIRFDGNLPLSLAGPDGPTLAVGTGMSVPRGNTQVFVLRFSRPATAETVLIEPSARIPAVNWTYGADTWTDGLPRLLTMKSRR